MIKKLLLLGGLLAAALLTLPSIAAVTTNAVVTAQALNVSRCNFVAGTDVAQIYKTCYSGGGNGSKIVGILATSTDAASHVGIGQLSTSTSAHCAPNTTCGGGLAFAIPISAGFVVGTPPVNVMSASGWPGLPIDSTGNPFLYLSGTGTVQTLEFTFQGALTAGSQITVTVIGSDF